MENETGDKMASAGPLTQEQLAAIQDEQVLNDMLDKAVDFEERRMIRAAMRELLKKKREQRDRERAERQQDLRQRGVCAGRNPAGQSTGQKPANGPGSTQQHTHRAAQAKSPNPSSASSSPKVPASPARPPAVGVKVHRSSALGGPNTKDVKQMLLDWCRAKTEPYEGVDIQNFSSSWADGLAFCALVHRFFPEGFDYCTLDPYDRRANFEKAFKTAERLADCSPLLDVDDLMRMREPDWKCVYTYIQEFYRCLVEKGLVKTKKKTP
ncbi:smoothelin [Colossoma macropomum]|uniref:smoothelin n=1 Tax=Colossoma macropomum TaxID=42526 RepID=UPI001864B127|nr:smoothelin [Colossoma macropomum]XP_036451706.1 smoothelin [Colossoma macropomum]